MTEQKYNFLNILIIIQENFKILFFVAIIFVTRIYRNDALVCVGYQKKTKLDQIVGESENLQLKTKIDIVWENQIRRANLILGR